MLTPLLPEVSFIVYAQLLDTQSTWNPSHTKIVTTHRLTVLDTLLGRPVRTIAVQTDGGYLADEALGLWVSHGVALQADRPLLLLLTAEEDHYRVAGGEKGVFVVENDQVYNHFLQLPVEQFVQQFNLLLAQAQHPQTQHSPAKTSLAVSDLWSTTAAGDGIDAQPLDHMALQDEQPRWALSATELHIKVNLNSTQISDVEKPRGAFYMAVAHALSTWSVVDGAD
ncbi:MAG: hypothetical protein KDE19_06955, partial [Caldilineaceae bacterium]|nr:hypothetical protein [Caldilineaceae bacterium]